ncbi:serine/threonine-protein kinase [Phenylobacterium sp. J426]|uniref:serine/threonine-protein kinase n=1 Tax=Phenylobacterium sp. J426 TaxID=2898439 RepID=UPI00215129B9|nr:serine/threonine-protein kinase [Phenylobacterium sp. J426]MCR5876765.1 serine/threonine-protein kinase [Phenylobacterium sp. J426]
MDWEKVEAALDEALEHPPSERRRLVHDRLGSDAVLEREALSLLAAAEDSAAFLGPAAAPSADLECGARFGAWQVADRLGGGGMGEVYRVERADGAYRQQAALKLMRPLPATYWSRFQAERQILAELEHPGVARLLDGGLSADNRPFMVLEYVDGAPIDAWCDAKHADVRRRVGLILEVCEAVAHAHAKLVVHRDIKPSNILVTEDGRTRLIDFGVARLMAAGDGARTETPVSIEYAAPELLEGASATVMTDVYGLAATLFELLTGRPPIVVTGDPMAVAVRKIAEAPAERLLTAAPSGSAPGALARDLDAILARALRKEPQARYATVEAFAQDLTRALAGQPVKAREGERGYALGRFLRRRRWPIAAAAAVVLSLAGGLGAALVQAERAEVQRDAALREQARLEAVQQYLYFMFRNAAETGGPDADVAQVLENAAGQVLAQFEADPRRGGPLVKMLGELFFYLNDYEAAEPLLRRLVGTTGVEPHIVASAAYDLAQVELRKSEQAAAARHLEQAQAFWRREPDRWRSQLVDSRLVEARLLRDRGRVEDAVALLQRNLPVRIALSGANHRETGVYHNDLGVMLTAAGRPEEAIPSFRAALGVWHAAGLDAGPDALNTLNNLAALEVLQGRPDRAEPLFRRALDVRRRLYGPSAATAALLSNSGKTLLQLDRPGEAVPLLEEAVDMAREHAGPGSLHYASAVAGLSEAYLGLGRTGQAAGLSEAALRTVRAALGESHPATAVVAVSLGRVRAAQGRGDEARSLLDGAQRSLSALGPAGATQIRAIDQIRSRYALR